MISNTHNNQHNSHIQVLVDMHIHELSQQFFFLKWSSIYAIRNMLAFPIIDFIREIPPAKGFPDMCP